MKTYLDCIPCFFKQALEGAKRAGLDRKTQKKILDEICKAIPSFPFESSPPEMGGYIYNLIGRYADYEDVYKEVKEKSNKLAMDIYESLEKRVDDSDDKLLTALELAIAGNIIDYGVKNSLDVNDEIQKILKNEERKIKTEGKRLFNYGAFRETLVRTRSVLYLGDNAGECVFDRLLIREIRRLNGGKRIVYAVKESPIINDALAADAKMCGIDEIAELVSTGLNMPGTMLSACSEEFLDIYESADVVISKGQGNFESLSDTDKEIFYLFMAKCPVVAEEVGCKVGDVILLKQERKG